MLPLLIGFYAKGFQCHGDGDVAADGKDEVHPLPLVETFTQRGPRRVGEFVFLHQLVDSGQNGAVEFISGLTALPGETITLRLTFKEADPLTIHTVVIPAKGPYASITPGPTTPSE